MNTAIAYLLTLVAFAVIDTAWLGAMGDRLYRPLIGSMLAENFRLAPAVAFYALYAAGLTIFAVLPGLAEGGWKKALLWGGVLGLFAYGTYDLTNLATLKTWSLKLSLIDMAWGVCVSAGAVAGRRRWCGRRRLRRLRAGSGAYGLPAAARPTPALAASRYRQARSTPANPRARRR